MFVVFFIFISVSLVIHQHLTTFRPFEVMSGNLSFIFIRPITYQIAKLY